MPERPAVRHQPDHLDRAIELASGAIAVGMFTYGVALSYSVLHAAGLPPWAARLWPLGLRRSWPRPPSTPWPSSATAATSPPGTSASPGTRGHSRA
jgi:hypothetical protein